MFEFLPFLSQTARIVLPMIAAVCFILMFWALQSLYGRWRTRQRLDYRARYRRLLYLFEQSTVLCNQLGDVVESVKPEAKLLNYYHGTLEVLETLLKTVKALNPLMGEPETLETSLYLAKDLLARCQRVKVAFEEYRAHQHVDYDKLFQQDKPGYLDVIGCYFCSRPYKADFFAHVKVKVEGRVLDVFACKICEQELVHTNSVRILSFMKDGKSIHWSRMKGYKPSAEYWHLNLRDKKDVVRRRPKLQLVKTKPVNFEHPSDSPS